MWHDLYSPSQVETIRNFQATQKNKFSPRKHIFFKKKVFLREVLVGGERWWKHSNSIGIPNQPPSLGGQTSAVRGALRLGLQRLAAGAESSHQWGTLEANRRRWGFGGWVVSDDQRGKKRICFGLMNEEHGFLSYYGTMMIHGCINPMCLLNVRLRFWFLVSKQNKSILQLKGPDFIHIINIFLRWSCWHSNIMMKWSMYHLTVAVPEAGVFTFVHPIPSQLVVVAPLAFTLLLFSTLAGLPSWISSASWLPWWMRQTSVSPGLGWNRASDAVYVQSFLRDFRKKWKPCHAKLKFLWYSSKIIKNTHLLMCFTQMCWRCWRWFGLHGVFGIKSGNCHSLMQIKGPYQDLWTSCQPRDISWWMHINHEEYRRKHQWTKSITYL